ncbi:hydantoinase/oxoprolinase family protein [Alicyclobacillus sp. SO9]|uniref:hydantoinase/oxoprolinase family protein n=1 Tax=Alicyclobacillus sp. SO9 TaxID=2665646 RepID=UPI0018E8927B|nr:hydantoinase/oxoprolinase family protein [Alicyclobacillus sp. SO9]QQE80474.1 hydantoinase/oxoprolinase family protein [Alicyclobacillus sp. SO9]
MNLRLGIDVGGTNTDAVILNPSGELLAKAKRPTTSDVTNGIRNVLRAVLESEAGKRIERKAIVQAMLGTTHCTNAIVERKGLSRVAVLRIAAPASLAIPPLSDWPEDFVEKLNAQVEIVEGGHEYNGQEIVPLNEGAIQHFAHRVRGVRAVAVTGIFAPVSDAHERRAERILREILGDEVSITLSSQIGSVGLLERENATILNAALTDVAIQATSAFNEALSAECIEADKYFSQNDGTLMRFEYALRHPILTVASGPTNSLRGAAYLTGRTDAVVIDVGGTTSDIGVLANGFPRESAVAVEIGGVRTNFRMPDLISKGLGGGTKVIIGGNTNHSWYPGTTVQTGATGHAHKSETVAEYARQNGYEGQAPVQVGPESVGYRLAQEAQVFGGGTLTMTDIATRTGAVQIGDPELVSEVPLGAVRDSLIIAREMLADGLDRMKTSAAAVPLIAVGGGSFLVPNDLEGASEVLRPENSDVANAIGAAIAQVSGEVDQIFMLGEAGRSAALAGAKAKAIELAIKAGADKDQVQVIEVEEVPLGYIPGNASRIRVKAAGPLVRLATIGTKEDRG